MAQLKTWIDPPPSRSCHDAVPTWWYSMPLAPVTVSAGYWQEGDRPTAEPRFDLGTIDELLRTIEEHNTAWSRRFAEQASRRTG